MSPATQRVIPYVEDRRNALLLTSATQLEAGQMASLAAGLKRAIQLEYQLEEQELAVEPLPGPENRRLLLFFESAEGGAGVLRRLVTESRALARAAHCALEVCHFDPAGADQQKADGAQEDCEAACYDCLMNYGNQPDHRLLDRHAIRDELLRLAQATVEISPGPLGRDEHVQRLQRLCQSELERRFLRFLDRQGLELPSRAQGLLDACHARPDFLYDDGQVAVFVDGPVHEYPDVAARDEQAAERLEDGGWSVVRFPDDETTWADVVRRWPNVFGRLP
jgi:very-short-patch-repair endonuclease